MSKKNLVLGGLLVVLVGFAYIQQGPWQEWKQNVGKPDNFLSAINIGQVEQIEISHGTSTKAVLEREDEYWKVGGTKDFYVKKFVVDKLEDVITDMSKTELEIVSKNENNKSEFGTDESGVEVKIVQAGEDYRFIVGNTGPTAASCYISKVDSEETYLLDVNIRTVFIRDDWRDDQIFSFMSERAKKVRFQYLNREFTVEKIENAWKGTRPYNFSVDEEKIMDVIDIMSDLKAVEIPEQTFEGTGLEKNSMIIEISDSMDTYTIMVGDDNEDGYYYAKKGSSDNIYLITSEEREGLDKYISDLE